MTSIAREIRILNEEIPAGVKLVAVSKFHPVSAVREAYDAGQRLFGESRVQELLEKIPLLPGDIKWHFIGHLQTNKVRQLIGKTALIESVDSTRLLNLIDKESERMGVITEVLLQLHVAVEETKFGFSIDEYTEFFDREEYRDLKFVKLCGVMGMASNVDDEAIIRNDFRKISDAFRYVAGLNRPELSDFKIISMGMSHDWPIAVEEGSNLVRIGSRIFGERSY